MDDAYSMTTQRFADSTSEVKGLDLPAPVISDANITFPEVIESSGITAIKSLVDDVGNEIEILSCPEFVGFHHAGTRRRS